MQACHRCDLLNIKQQSAKISHNYTWLCKCLDNQPIKITTWFRVVATSLDGINGWSIQTLLRGENDLKHLDEIQKSQGGTGVRR